MCNMYISIDLLTELIKQIDEHFLVLQRNLWLNKHHYIKSSDFTLQLVVFL